MTRSTSRAELRVPELSCECVDARRASPVCRRRTRQRSEWRGRPGRSAGRGGRCGGAGTAQAASATSRTPRRRRVGQQPSHCENASRSSLRAEGISSGSSRFAAVSSSRRRRCHDSRRRRSAHAGSACLRPSSSAVPPGPRRAVPVLSRTLLLGTRRGPRQRRLRAEQWIGRHTGGLLRKRPPGPSHRVLAHASPGVRARPQLPRRDRRPPVPDARCRVRASSDRSHPPKRHGRSGAILC